MLNKPDRIDDIVTNCCVFFVFFLKNVYISFFIVLFYHPLFWFSYFIECSLGNYGYNCNQSCDGCLSNSCKKENGVCTSGCKPGRQLGLLMKCDKGTKPICYLSHLFLHRKETFRQIVDIQMGTNCAPLVANLFLCCMAKLQNDSSRFPLISLFNSNCKYLDDFLTVSNSNFLAFVKQMYTPFQSKCNNCVYDERNDFLSCNFAV